VIDFLDVIRTESARFGACIRDGDMESAVPSCPDWTLADLAWHLTQTQHFWGSIAGDLLLEPDHVVELTRPEPQDVPALFDRESARLVEALSRHPAETRCWTWDDDGWSIGWVRRRQAHEALIHRVDAELTIGNLTDIDDELAADGVDELLYSQIDGVPEWGSFIPDETTATLSIDGGASYGLRFGRIVGVGPESGKEYDLDTFLVSEPSGTVISGSATDLDLWLWGRGSSGIRCDDDALLARIRAIVAEVTQ
jgi:uncharacterized protein (TIGR03083 family)